MKWVQGCVHIRLDAVRHARDLCSYALQCRRHRAADSAGVHHETSSEHMIPS